MKSFPYYDSIIELTIRDADEAAHMQAILDLEIDDLMELYFSIGDRTLVDPRYEYSRHYAISSKTITYKIKQYKRAGLIPATNTWTRRRATPVTSDGGGLAGFCAGWALGGYLFDRWFGKWSG